MNARIGLAGLLLLASSGWAQQQKSPPAPRIDDAKVDAAIKRGVLYLRAKTPKAEGGAHNPRELVLLALAHSGVPKADPFFDGLLKSVLEEDLKTNYRTALQAMVLEEVDRAFYQKRIFQCAQFLVDNQCVNGQWSYGEPTTYPEPVPSPDLNIATGTPIPGQKPPVLLKYPVKKQRDGPEHGDNSCSQYAALGLRACHDSGIILPREVVQKAAQSWRDDQGAAKGWSYGPKGNNAYGSMSAGAIAALTICDYILGVDWKKDVTLTSGMDWLRDNFTVLENPGRHSQHHYYFLYALERAGMLSGTDRIGKVDWYFEGARYLLENQVDDGSWGKKPVDTCFAILFLRRATRPLVASVDPKK
jgi:hypothetical protein